MSEQPGGQNQDQGMPREGQPEEPGAHEAGRPERPEYTPPPDGPAVTPCKEPGDPTEPRPTDPFEYPEAD